jgi:hypothetical protein
MLQNLGAFLDAQRDSTPATLASAVGHRAIFPEAATKESFIDLQLRNVPKMVLAQDVLGTHVSPRAAVRRFPNTIKSSSSM